MLNTEELSDKRNGGIKYKSKDKSVYSRMRFRMYDGDEQTAALICDNNMANVIIDQFGRETKLQKLDDEHFKAKVDVAVSDQFLGWIIALGKIGEYFSQLDHLITLQQRKVEELKEFKKYMLQNMFM